MRSMWGLHPATVRLHHLEENIYICITARQHIKIQPLHCQYQQCNGVHGVQIFTLTRGFGLVLHKAISWLVVILTHSSASSLLIFLEVNRIVPEYIDHIGGSEPGTKFGKIFNIQY